MPDVRNKKLKYERISTDEIWEVLTAFKNRFIDFLSQKGFPEDVNYYISTYNLLDVIIRVDKRKAYYYCFHNMEIDECKEIALYAYWILKLRPFTITNEKYKGDYGACNINESFVIYLIGFILEKIKRIEKPEQMDTNYTDFLEYSFRFRHFSIDSFVVLIESISTGTLEREYPNLHSEYFMR